MSDPKTFGTKNEVYKGKALKTRGGLTKSDLMKNKRGKVVSKKQHEAGLKRYEQNKAKLQSFQIKATVEGGAIRRKSRKPKVREQKE